MPDKNTEKLQKATVKELLAYFDAPQLTRPNLITSARLAQSTLSAITRLRATEQHEDANKLGLLRHLSENKDEFKKYLAVSMPHLNPAALIEDKP